VVLDHLSELDSINVTAALQRLAKVGVVTLGGRAGGCVVGMCWWVLPAARF